MGIVPLPVGSRWIRRRVQVGVRIWRMVVESREGSCGLDVI